ncbi:MAG: hypothetical protein GY760_15095 [Deltaproteobacteria bacterium]|nr:hypothetical protein [Deltaproteobacteria bacterium]
MDTGLIKIIKESQVKKALQLIRMGTGVNNKALYYAALYQLSELIDPMCEKIDVNIKYRGLPPLHIAVREGYTDITQLLIKNGADVNIADDDDSTPLHKAAANGHLEILKLLIELGANLYVTNKYNYNAADLAKNKTTLKILAKSDLKPKIDHKPWKQNQTVYMSGEFPYFVYSGDAPTYKTLKKALNSEHDSVYILMLPLKRLMKQVPEEIKQFVNLEILSIQRNSITEIPGFFKGFRNLNILDLRDNQLETLPDFFAGMKVRELYLQNNRFSDMEKLRIREMLPKCKVVF